VVTFAGTETEEFTEESAQFAPISPFAEAFQLQSEADGREYEGAPVASLESPFRAEYEMLAEGSAASPEREAYENMVASLHDTEFSEALYEIAAEAWTTYEQQYGESEAASSTEVEAYLERYMAPLGTEAEALFERLSEQYAQHDISTLTENEVDRLFETLQPSFGHLSPGFENFLGGLWKKAKSLAKGAVSLAKRGIAAVGKIIPLGFIFDKLKALIKPLLKRVLQFAIGRLPGPLQPVASKLAKKLFGETGEVSEAELQGELEAEGVTGEALAHADPDTMQREFDARSASLFFARDEAERDAVATEAVQESAQTEVDRVAELEAARDQFAREITSLPRGQDPTAQMENFLPAVMGVLRLGVSIIGRKRVIGFLAGHLANVVKPYVGSDIAKPLSNAVVSTGMGLVGLEVPAERELLAGEAIASAVEGTVRRLAEQGEHIYEDQRLLEAAVQEAFAEAAAESFPPEMIRQSLHEVSPKNPAMHGTWVLRPHKGRRRYKRFTRAIDVTVTSQMGSAVHGFGAIPLNDILKARFGVSTPVKARAYLFEAIPGTTLSAIARLEKHIPGLGPNSPNGWKLFIPLSRQTAGTLFGEPGLGHHVAHQFTLSHHRLAVGQRVVVLIPEGARAGGQGSGRPSEVNATFDFPSGEIRASIYLSERDAQSVAQSIRRGESTTASIVLLRKLYGATLRTMLSASPGKHVKVVHEVAVQEQFAGKSLGAAGEAILKIILEKLLAWIDGAIADYFGKRRQEFVAAADKQADGVTIIVVSTHNAMMAALRKILKGDMTGGAIAITKALLAPVSVSVRTVPGFQTQ
jgi:hypothetical protein